MGGQGQHSVKRLLPKLFALAAWWCGILCALTCLIWVVSLTEGHTFGWAGWGNGSGTWVGWGADLRRHQLLLFHFTGKLQVRDPSHVSDLPEPPGWWHTMGSPRRARVTNNGGLAERIGLGYWRINPTFSPPVAIFVVGVPYALLVVVFAILPAHAVVRRVRRRQADRRVGFCQRCGYDLRETPERCPECGTIPAPATVAI